MSYWEAVDGTEIRSIVLGKHSTVTSLDIEPGKGDFFMTSSNDSFVKVCIWTQRANQESNKVERYSISNCAG